MSPFTFRSSCLALHCVFIVIAAGKKSHPYDIHFLYMDALMTHNWEREREGNNLWVSRRESTRTHDSFKWSRVASCFILNCVTFVTIDRTPDVNFTSRMLHLLQH